MRSIILLLLILLAFPVGNVFAGILNNPFLFLSETDYSSRANYSFFDLRDRESFIQITNIESSNITVHVQIFDVANLCNENNFFDSYTPNDTHVYNMRDILSNDGNPSGVDLPDNAYGIVFVSFVFPPNMESDFFIAPIIGNFRIVDNSGYEYRTNAQSNRVGRPARIPRNLPAPVASFNFNVENGIGLSDVVGIPINFAGFLDSEPDVSNPVSTFIAVDVDIINNTENLFSCRDVVFACIDENSPLQEEVLAAASGDTLTRSSASVARYEYGINEAIPHSKGGELLCPGNNINEGIVNLTLENFSSDLSGLEFFGMAGYIGLNNGNGRGSMESMSTINFPLIFAELNSGV